MSSVDERVVKMEFDNKQFEDGVSTTVKSLDNLKKGLNLDSSAKSLSNLGEVGKNFSLANIADGVSNISSKFTALGVIGVTALANITNSVVNTGKAMLRSLTVEPIMEGLSNYETKINAIQTILANTQSKGTTIDDVTKSLAELNTYANQTVYNFSDMTKNIGTFTAAGVDLKTSVSSIKGIANLAAMSGSSAEQASTAMYQLSQAIASGSVKLQDWNSVVNAGMGGTAFQEALERTARAHGVAVDDMIKKEGSFRESLKSGWVTSQILTETLSQYTGDFNAEQLKSMGYTEQDIQAILQMGKTANDSATKIRTMTQMTQALKEEVGTAWATVWEDLFGNLNQATDLFTKAHTTLENLLTNNVYALDSLLKEWDKLGGRDTVIKTITNAFNGLSSILNPVKEAFTDVFPPMTAQQLMNITKAIADLTDHFKIGDKTASDIKNTFKGLFSILDIGKQAVGAVVGVFGDLVKDIMPSVSSAGGGILSFTASMGRAISSFDEMLKHTDSFSKALQKVEDILEPIVSKIKSSADTVIETFQSFGKADLSGLDSFSDRIQKRFSPLTALATLVEKAASAIWAAASKLAPIFSAIAEKVGEGLKALDKKIADGISTGNFSSLLDLFNTGMFAVILVGIKKFMSSLTDLAKGAKGTFSGISEILEGVKGILKEYQNQLKASTLLKIAASIGILSAALLVLSTIDSAKLAEATAAMSAMFVELFGSMGVFEKVMGSESFKGIGKVSASMIGVSIAILILSDAMTKLAKLDWEGLAKGLSGLAAIFALILGFVDSLNTEKMAKLNTTAAGMVIFGAAIEILANAVKKLGSLDIATLSKGLIGLAAILTEISLFLQYAKLSQGKGYTSTVNGILILSAALEVISSVVKKLGELDPGKLTQGLIGLAAILTEISLFLGYSKFDSKGMMSSAISLTILGSAMLIFTDAVGKLGSMSYEQLGKGLISMAVALTEIVAAMRLLPNDKNMIGIGTGLILFSTAMVILSNALSSMGGMSYEAMAKGLTMLAASLVIIIAAMDQAEGTLPGAAAMLVMSAALTVLTGVLMALGSMSIQDIATALIALFGAFTVLGVAATVLAPVIPAMIGLSGAITLLGIAALAVGAGMLAFSAGLAALAISGAAGSAALVVAVEAILSLIPITLTALGEGIIAFIDVIAGSSDHLIAAATTLLMAFITTVQNISPLIIACIMTLLITMLNALADAVPKMVDAGMRLIVGILQGIAAHVGEVVAAGIDIIVQFLNGVSSKIPSVIDAAFKVIISFINGLAEAIRSNHNSIYDAMGNLNDAIVGAILDLPGRLWEAGANSVQGMIDGLKSKFNDIRNVGENLGGALLKRVKDFLGIHSPSTEFAEIGRFSVLGLVAGLNNYSDKAASAAQSVGSNAMDALSSSLSGISSVVAGGIDTTPTIRPVLDLTDIKSGQEDLSSMLGQNQSIDVSASASQANAAAQSAQVSNQNGSDLQKAIDELKSEFSSVMDTLNKNPTTVQFNGEYSFRDENDMDTFLNKAKLLVDRRSV